MQWIVYGMVFLGSALMIFNIIGFIRFAHFIKKSESWDQKNAILYIPIILLVLFLLGYLAVGIFGKPDLIVSGILFGGSIFVFFMYILLNNITKRIIDRERHEAELIATEQSNQMKNTFLASISHEMRTPMNVILGLTRKTAARQNLPDEVKEEVRKTHESAELLHVLINNMLDLSEIASGEFQINNEEFELTDMLRRVGDITQILCANRGLEFRTVVGDGTCFRYYGDEMLMAQILLGILDNAVKYTEAPGTVTFTTSCIAADEDTRTLEFMISDTGVGIDEKFLPKIFDLFAQEDGSSTTRFGGTGAGLAAVKSKLEMIGGTVKAESRKDEGSTFIVTVPLTLAGRQNKEPAAGEEAPIAEKEETAGAEEVSLEGKRILIVEDIPENAEIVADLLELEGAISDHAENGQVAIEMFSETPPFYYDAILMDLRMPIVDGLEAAKNLRKMDREDAKVMPIIALTANAFENDRQMTREAGMNEHLTKPIDPDLLYTTLRNYIYKTQQLRKDDV